jgi:hypothetical protein
MGPEPAPRAVSPIRSALAEAAGHLELGGVAATREQILVAVAEQKRTRATQRAIEGLLGESAGEPDPVDLEQAFGSLGRSMREILAGDPEPGNDCDCHRDGDWHPIGTGGCILPSAAAGGRPVEVVELPEYIRAELDVEAGLQAIVGEPAEGGVLPDHRAVLVGEQGPELFVPPAPPYEWAYHLIEIWSDGLPEVGAFIVREPGIYDVEQEVYFADPVLGGSMSNSDGRALSLPGCPEQFHHDKIHGVRKVSDAFDLGHAAHAEVLGVGVELAVFPKHDARTKEGKVIRAEWDQARADGKTPILEEKYAEVQAMAEALRRHPFASQLLAQPMDVEQCLFWRDQATGVMRRAMLDMLPTGRAGQSMVMVDYKTAQSVAPDHAMRKKIYDNGYHRQMATYIDAVLALGLAESVRAILLFQCTKAPYIVTPVELDAEALRIGRIENLRALDVFEECTRTGVWPGYTDGVEVAGVPYYIERDYEGVNR